MWKSLRFPWFNCSNIPSTVPVWARRPKCTHWSSQQTWNDETKGNFSLVGKKPRHENEDADCVSSKLQAAFSGLAQLGFSWKASCETSSSRISKNLLCWRPSLREIKWKKTFTFPQSLSGLAGRQYAVGRCTLFPRKGEERPKDEFLLPSFLWEASGSELWKYLIPADTPHSILSFHMTRVNASDCWWFKFISRWRRSSASQLQQLLTLSYFIVFISLFFLLFFLSL